MSSGDPGVDTVETLTRSAVITARAAATFDPVGRSVATARSFVRDTLQGWGFTDIVDDAVVLTSELVTNAVVHAGTAADVLCLRSEDAVRIEVSDRYPEREIPLQQSSVNMGSPDREGGRGLQLCAALATRWGVDYTPTHKLVWFQLDLPHRPVGTRTAGPALPADLLPVADGRVRVAVIQIDRTGAINAWNEDAEDLFGYAAEQVIGKPLNDLAAWPHTPGTSTGIAEALQLSRWEGSYGIRGSHGRVIPVYASHLRVRDNEGEPSTVCLLVRDDERAVLQTPLRGATPEQGTLSEPNATDPFEVFIGSPAPEDLDGLLQRTVERARDMLDGDAAFLLLSRRRRDGTGGPRLHRPALGPPALRPRPRRGGPRALRLGPHAGRPRGPHPRPRRRPAAERHGHALRRHGPAQGRRPPHRLPRRRRGGPRPVLERRGPAPAVRRRPHRPRRGVRAPRRAGAAPPRLPLLPRRGLRPPRGHPGPRPDPGPHGPDDGPDPRHLVRRLHHRRPVRRALPLVRPARGRGAHRRPEGTPLQDRPAGPGSHPGAPASGAPPRRPPTRRRCAPPCAAWASANR